MPIDLTDDLTRQRLKRLADIAQEAAEAASETIQYKSGNASDADKCVMEIGAEAARDAAMWVYRQLEEAPADA